MEAGTAFDAYEVTGVITPGSIVALFFACPGRSSAACCREGLRWLRSASGEPPNVWFWRIGDVMLRPNLTRCRATDEADRA